MLERVKLKAKLLKIKEFEINKKIQYYIERKIRQFIKENEHSESKFYLNIKRQIQNRKALKHFMKCIKKTLKLKFLQQNN